MLARGRPVDTLAHGVYGDSKGNIYLAEPRLNQVVKLVRRAPVAPGPSAERRFPSYVRSLPKARGPAG